MRARNAFERPDELTPHAVGIPKADEYRPSTERAEREVIAASGASNSLSKPNDGGSQRRPVWVAKTAMGVRKAMVPMLIIAVWVAATMSRWIDPVYVPSPLDLWTALVEVWPRLPSALLSSVGVTLAGFFCGSATGLAMGLAMAYSRHVRDLFGAVLDFLRPVPTFALIPLFVLWFGLGKAPQGTCRRSMCALHSCWGRTGRPSIAR
jgi:hypothetical protein